MTRENSRSRNILVRLLAVFALLAAEATSAAAVGAGRTLVVRYETDGDSAVLDCAERIWQRQTRYADATADRSDSLDRWHARHAVRTVRALFRRTHDDTLVQQTRLLAARLGRGMARRRARQAYSPGRLRRESTTALEHARLLAPIYRIELDDTA